MYFCDKSWGDMCVFLLLRNSIKAEYFCEKMMEGKGDKAKTNDIRYDLEADDADFLHEGGGKTVNRPPNAGRPDNFAVSRGSPVQQGDCPEPNTGEEMNRSNGATGVCFQNNGKYRRYYQIGNAGNVVPQETDSTKKEHFSFWLLANSSTPVSGFIQNGKHDIQEHINSPLLNSLCSNMKHLESAGSYFAAIVPDPIYSCARDNGSRQEHSPRQESTNERRYELEALIVSGSQRDVKKLKC